MKCRYVNAIMAAEGLDREGRYGALVEAISLSPHTYFRIEIGEPIPWK